MNRRSFLSSLSAGLAATVLTTNSSVLRAANRSLRRTMIDSPLGYMSERSEHILQELFAKASKLNWNQLPIGDLMEHLGRELVNTPYVGATLEIEGPERPVVNLEGLDCVTFFENCLAIARSIKFNKLNTTTVLEQIRLSRYRDAHVDGYCSRLHYTAEWLSNNETKQVVHALTPELLPDRFALHVDFMSKHPQFYPALKNDAAAVRRIAEIESGINAKQHWFIPKDKVAAIENQLRSGDIIAIATSKQGLDYAHTGMISRGSDAKSRFLHASLAKKMVTLDTTISEYLQTVSSHIGISVARPLELHEH